MTEHKEASITEYKTDIIAVQSYRTNIGFWQPLLALRESLHFEKDFIRTIVFFHLVAHFRLMSIKRLSLHLKNYCDLKRNNPHASIYHFAILDKMIPDSIAKNLILLRRPTGENLIAGYQILKPLDEGAIATIYLAKKLDTNEYVAIKIVAPFLDNNDGEKISRFKRECSLAMKIESPFIIKSYESGYFCGLYYLVMEYFPGESLAEKIKREGTLSQNEALTIFGKLLEGMKEAWKYNIIHRDIKPKNIIIKSDQVKICDLGLAKALDGGSDITKTGTVLGTPQFIASEQFHTKKVDYRVDVYSLGVTLHMMLFGKLPPAKIFYSSNYVPETTKGIARCITVFVFKLLAKSPENRCESIEELVSDYHRVKNNKYPKGYLRLLFQQKRKYVVILLIAVIAILCKWIIW